MDLQRLPLELFEAILAEAMLVRGVCRALRLRLVNKFFSTEVIKLLARLRMLDDSQVRIRETGIIGAAYFEQRLLSKQPNLSPRLDNMRQIASRFTREDADADINVDITERYAEYIRTLSSLISSECWFRIHQLFVPDKWAEEIGVLEYDLLTAAAYTGKLSIVQELSEREKNTKVTMGTLRNPYTAAALGGNTAVIDRLLQQADIHSDGPRSIVMSQQLGKASEAGLTSTVEHLLASKWFPELKQGTEMYTNFHDALNTPNIETFDALMRFKKTMPRKDLTQEQLMNLLYNAAENGWEDMAAHLLKLGAPKEGEQYEDHKTPLFAACNSGSAGIVRLLLQQQAKITNADLEIAAKRGQLGILMMLLDRENVNRIAPRPETVASAIYLEHEALFRLLLDHGVELEEIDRQAALDAEEAVFDSMLSLLGKHSVKIRDA